MSAAVPPTPDRWPAALGRPVRVVGPNPAMDRIEVLDRIRPGQVHRVRAVSATAGGKSLIVARSMRTLGADVALYGFLGGPIGTLVTDECRTLGIVDRHTPIAGETRITVVLVEESGRSTVLNEPGPPVTAADVERLTAQVQDDLRADDLVSCTGSLPPGVDPGLYAALSDLGAARGAYVAVDASGPTLERALAAAPWMVKCNHVEFAAAVGCPPDAGVDGALADAARRQVTAGSTVVIVTMGGSAFLLATPDGLWQVEVPATTTVNATGSGDTFLGCFLATVAAGGGLADAVRAATAGGVANAGQLLAGLRSTDGLAELAAAVGFSVPSTPARVA